MYLYDFGDRWEHRVVDERIEFLDNVHSAGEAWVVAGDRACPPEDISGVGQYQDLLGRIENDPYGETNQAREWAGLDAPKAFARMA